MHVVLECQLRIISLLGYWLRMYGSLWEKYSTHKNSFAMARFVLDKAKTARYNDLACVCRGCCAYCGIRIPADAHKFIYRR